LTLRLLIDEDSQAKYLVNLLRNAGHDVITVNEADLMGKSDSIVLKYAISHGRILLTRNCEDFLNLHTVNPNHPGILAVYQNSEASKFMSYLSIVKSISNLEALNYMITNQFIPLNQWNF
jgi:predicted nuclease of predicted toxin-antitoxin system